MITYARLGHIYKDIWSMVRGLRYFSISCVKRNANSVAHSLAKFARQVDHDVIWLEENPQPALDALYLIIIRMNDTCFWIQKKKKVPRNVNWKRLDISTGMKLGFEVKGGQT